MPPLPLVDAYPEHVNYRDEGCDLCPSCLACPLPACRYDLPRKQAAVLMLMQRLQDLLSQGEGLTTDELAARLGVSRRTAFRAKARLRKEG